MESNESKEKKSRSDSAKEAAQKMQDVAKKIMPALEKGSAQVVEKASQAGMKTEVFIKSKVAMSGALGVLALFGLYSVAVELYNFFFGYADYFGTMVFNLAPLLILGISYAIVKVAAKSEKK